MPDVTVAQLRWRCRRGMKELDLLLGDWLERGWDAADVGERESCRWLIEQPDRDRGLAGCRRGRAPRRSSMTSFAVAIEPAAQPRLAALLLLMHGIAAAGPWIARCPTVPAAALSLLALAGLGWSLARVPGTHCALRGLVLDAGGCRCGCGLERSGCPGRSAPARAPMARASSSTWSPMAAGSAGCCPVPRCRSMISAG
jgi:antitoxin CptB